MPILFLFAFISGLVTIAAPCIWPLLPIVLSASSTGGHKKPLGVTLGIIISFGVLTLLLSYIVKVLPINLDLLRLIAAFVLIMLGLSLLIPKFSAILETYVSRLSGKFGRGSSGNGFMGGLLTGVTLGAVWTPCAGPILATIATLAATTRVNSQIILVTFFYLVGIGIPLFIFATVGRKLFTKTRFFSKYTGIIQQIFGIIMILTALLIFTNKDKVLSVKLLDAIPSYSAVLNSFESSNLISSQLSELRGQANTVQVSSTDLLNTNAPAIEFAGITKWINSDPLTMSKLRGKVVLIDFWTYTCINCIRTLPHITSWYNKYKDQGFLVIGVHTPEFEFEKNTSNVSDAIKQYGIKYPVAQDNNYATWNAYSNQYWPAEYLVDSKGIVRRVHFGEGEYDKSEEAIKLLLKEAGKEVPQALDQMPDQTPNGQISPETYLGTDRMQNLYPNGSTTNGSQSLILGQNIPVNSFTLGGYWNIGSKKSITGQNSVLEYNFVGNNVYLVLNPAGSGKSQVKVYLDGSLVDEKVGGKDVSGGLVNISSDRLYHLIDLRGRGGNHILRLEFSPGVGVFAFTFG